MSASEITGVRSSEFTTTDSSHSNGKIASSGLVPLRIAARVIHNASIIKSQKAKSEGVIDSKFAQLIAGGDLVGSIVAAPVEGNSSGKLRADNRRSKSTTGSNELSLNIFDLSRNHNSGDRQSGDRSNANDSRGTLARPISRALY